jgi:hypothetical protein
VLVPPPDVVLRVVGQVLVQVGQAVGILGQLLVDDAVLVTCSQLPEAVQVDEVQRTDVVRLAAQVVLPEAALPEPEEGGRGQHLEGSQASRGMLGVRGVVLQRTPAVWGAVLPASSWCNAASMVCSKQCHAAAEARFEGMHACCSQMLCLPACLPACTPSQAIRPRPQPLPTPVLVHLFVVVTEGSVCHGSAANVHVVEL